VPLRVCWDGDLRGWAGGGGGRGEGSGPFHFMPYVEFPFHSSMHVFNRKLGWRGGEGFGNIGDYFNTILHK
jgi:hypothetical protein